MNGKLSLGFIVFLIAALLTAIPAGAQTANQKAAGSKSSSTNIPGFPMPKPQSPGSKNYTSSIPGIPMPKPQSPGSKNYSSSVPGVPMPKPQSPGSKNYSSSAPGFSMPKPQSPGSKNYSSSVPGFSMPQPQSPGSKNYSSSIPGFSMPQPQSPGSKNYSSSIPGFSMPQPQSPGSKNYSSSIPGFSMPQPQSPGSKNYSSSIPGFPMPQPQIPGPEETETGTAPPADSGSNPQPKPKSYSQRYREFFSSPNYGRRYSEAYNSPNFRQNYRNLGSGYFASSGDSRKRLRYPGGGGFSDPYATGMDDTFDNGNAGTWGINGLNRHPLDSGGLFDQEHRSLNVPPAQNPDAANQAYPQWPSQNPLLQPPMLIPPHYIYPMYPIAGATEETDAELNNAASGLPGGATAPEAPRIIDATAAIQPKPAAPPSSTTPEGKSAADSPAALSPDRVASPTSEPSPRPPAAPAPRIASPQEWLYHQSIEAFAFRNYTKARETLERLITMAPDSPAVCFAYGLSLFYQGQYGQSAAALERSVALSNQTRTPLPSLQSLRLNPYDFRFHHQRLARYIEENPRDVDASTLFYLLTRAAG